jgi:hypothetical protein
VDKNKLDIQKELAELGDVQLGNTGQLGHVPFAYFDSFEQRLAERIQLEEQEMMLPKAMPFDVPENYFAQIDTTKIIEHSKPKLGWWKPMSIAATVAVLIVCGIYFLQPKQIAEPLAMVNVSIEEITPQEATEHILANIDDYAPDAIATIDETKPTENNIEQELKNLDETEIQEYLNTQQEDEIL